MLPRRMCWRYLIQNNKQSHLLTCSELIAFLEIQGQMPQSKDLPAKVLVPPLDFLSGRWSEPSQVEYLQNHCQAAVTDPARAVVIVLRLLTIRVELSRQHFSLKQALSWALDCLVRIWVVMSSRKLSTQMQSAYHVIAGSYLRALDTLSADVTNKVPGTVLPFKIASLYARSVVGLLQLCLTGLYPTLEEDVCASLLGLSRLPRTSTFIRTTGEIMLPSLRELTGDQPCTQRLAPELQVIHWDFVFVLD